MGKTDVLLLIRFVFLGLAALLFSCCSSRYENGATIKKNVTFFSEDSSVNKYLSQRKVVFKYLNSNNMATEIQFPKDSLFSTMIISTQGKYLEMNCKNNGLYEYSFLFQDGDSVQIVIQNQNLRLNVVNRDVLPYDDNFEFRRNTELFQSNYAPIDNFDFLWKSAKTEVVKIDLRNELRLKKKLAEQSLELEAEWLDSLKDAGQMSEENASYFLAKNRFQFEKLRFFDTEEGLLRAFVALQFFNSYKGVSDRESSTLYLDEFGDFFITQLSPLEYTELPKILPQYDGGTFRDMILFKYMKQELPKLSFRETDKWFEEYGSNLNSEWIEYLKEISRKLLQVEQDIMLKSMGGKNLSFEEILVQNNGSFVYVDLWAAWCVPCIKSFPYSLELQEDYKNEGVEILYLSVDKNHKYWENIVEKYDIAIPNRSFIVMNIGESKFLNELKVEFIPRYLLFDTDGKLFHQNAPRPESREIRILFDRLISE